MKPTESESDPTEELPFETTSDVEISRRDILYRYADQFLLAPMRIIWSDWRGKVGLSVVTLYVLIALVGTRIVPEPSTRPEYRLVGIATSARYPLGTNNKGEGILDLVVHATPLMLKMILAGALFGAVLGSIVGMVAGYKGGRIDSFLMFITDTFIAIPGLPLVMVLAITLEPQSPYLIGMVVVINAWTGLARAIRSQMLPLREAEYVESNRLMGISDSSIIAKDITPNLMPFIAINFITLARTVIFDTVALYYLGILTFGNHWGAQINNAYSQGAAITGLELSHWLFIPAIMVVVLALGLILLAQSADRLFNPRIRARHQKSTSAADEDQPEEGEEGGPIATH